jgi:uracil-DNA glycosylase
MRNKQLLFEKIKNCIDESWFDTIKASISRFDDNYVAFLLNDTGYFPKLCAAFSAFKTLKKNEVKYILFGQDPYPRVDSAIGYAFIDGRVKDIFADKGFSKEVNRATSLRNLLKHLLVCEGLLECDNLAKEAIGKIDKSGIVKSLDELRINLIKNGFLLLNMSLVFEDKSKSKQHIKEWSGFTHELLRQIESKDITLVLLGNYAKKISDLKLNFGIFASSHPYVNSFICDKRNIEFFKGFGLMKK